MAVRPFEEISAFGQKPSNLFANRLIVALVRIVIDSKTPSTTFR